jgi:hypothetical protein
VFPGDVRASGVHSGKEAVANLFDMTGGNVVATRWDVVNRQGRHGQNSGVTVTTLRRGKAVHIQDFIFDTGPNFRTAWGEGG